MKKYISIILPLFIIVLFCSCNNERVSVEKTEERYNTILSEIEKCMKEENIPDESCYFKEFDNGYGDLCFCFNNKIYLDIEIHNDRFNIFGDDYDSGVEKFRIEYIRLFNNPNEILNMDNDAFKIIPIVLSNILCEDIDIIENQLKEYIGKIKDNSQALLSDNEAKNVEGLIDYESEFLGKSFNYYLSDKIIPLGYQESIYFNGTTKQP